MILGDVCMVAEADEEDEDAGDEAAFSTTADETSFAPETATIPEEPVCTGDEVIVTLPGGSFRTVRLRFKSCDVKWAGNCFRPPDLTTILRICGLSVDISVAFGLLMICICGKFFVCTFKMPDGRAGELVGV